MNQRLSELLPWYVNGTLNAEDRAWVDEQLRNDPTAAGELNWYRSLEQRIKDDTPEVSDEIGLRMVMARIGAERAAAPRPVQPAPRLTLIERMSAWLGGINMNRAMGAAFALVLAQSLVITGLLLRPAEQGTEIRAVKPTVVEPGPFLKINFKGDAKEADIRLLLVQVRGSLAGGPGQLGDYFVRVPAGSIDAAATQVKASTIVEAVNVVDALPARE